ncbi:hypothetical protein EB796_007791 [Bugula neritina]|uniref:Uncharacterized protein n=1 Tax=Bugula neritina TaxID=10212 RepID=A0A7J7K5I6_BUGNE|nr:hypothetical protein EB796_007791 [Bugula neritina]
MLHKQQVKFIIFYFDNNYREKQSLLSDSVARPESEMEISLGQEVRRNVSEVADIIRQLLTDDFERVEQAYSQSEAYSSQKLTQESLYGLLRQFTYPPVTRGEIRELWSTLHTNKDNSLSWLQFISNFGFTGQTPSYVNSQKNPPKRGDLDYSLRSKKFNSDFEILQDGTRQKVEYRWEDLRRCFVALDPHKTGCVSDREFYDVVNEVCVHLSLYDLEQAMKRHAATDSRVNYVSFLTEFGPKKEVWHTGNDMFSLLTHPRTPLGIGDVVEPPQKGLIGISAKLRNTLSGSWKNLRRAFQKSVLQLANVVLDEDEVYHVMSQLDQDLTGRLDYNKFLGELFRPESQRSSTRQSGLLPLSRQSARLSAKVENKASRTRVSIA